MKICAVVVTCNRKELIKKCLDALLRQTYRLDKIIVVDNGSKDGTDRFFYEEYRNSPLIEYIKMQENTGSGGGFYEGIKRAYEQGFDWIWAIDDDSIFEIDALEKIISSEPFQKQRFGVFTSMVLDKDGNYSYRTLPSKVFKLFRFNIPATIEDFKKPYFQVQRIGFCAGFFMKREIVKKAGFPLRELFMGGGDTEYAERLSNVSGICLIPTSKTCHLDSTVFKEYRFLGMKIRKITPLGRLWFAYYSVRNRFFLARKHLNRFSYIRYLVIHVIRLLFGIIFFEDHKFLKFKVLIIKAVGDGLEGRLGKTIDPEEFTKEVMRSIRCK